METSSLPAADTDRDQSEYVIWAKTSQSSALKTLLDTLKDLLEDVTFEFDHDGIRLVATDNTCIAMVHMRLEASKFDEYRCPKPTTLGINVPRLHKLVRSVGNSDTVTLFMEGEDASSLGILVENFERRTCTNFTIGLMDIDTPPIEVPPVSFESSLMLPSSDLQRYIRDMTAISDRVEITNTDGRLTLACTGDFCSQTTVLEESTSFQSEMNGETSIIQGIFSLKYLALFCKCSSLCSTVTMNLKNNYPVVLNYAIAALGDVKLCLSPIFDKDA